MAMLEVGSGGARIVMGVAATAKRPQEGPLMTLGWPFGLVA